MYLLDPWRPSLNAKVLRNTVLESLIYLFHHTGLAANLHPTVSQILVSELPFAAGRPW